jgi:Protein of unknown function (DUF3108)
MKVHARIGAVAAMLALLTGSGLSGPAFADQKDQMVFDVTLKGIRAGLLSISGAVEGGSYAASGTLKTTGIVGAIKKIRYDASSAGRTKGGSFTPARYSEKANTGKRQSESVMAYKGGVPQVKVYNPPRAAAPGDVNPADMGGTVDPLTALYAVLRDVPQDQACRLKVGMFDGKRSSQVVLSQPETADGNVTCAGEYRRLKGFSADDMAEKQRFAFRLTYAPAENGMLRVTEVSMDTLYGKGSLTRR